MYHASKSTGAYTGEYMAPKHKASTVRGAYMSEGDSVGVGDGLSALSGFTEYLDNVHYNNTVDPVSGNPRQVPKPYTSTSVSEKGHDFNIC